MDNENVGTDCHKLTPLYDRKGVSIAVYKFRGHNMISLPITAENLAKLNSLKIRTDDILLCSYPGTGAHWLFEIANMLLKENSERIPTIKEDAMLELTPFEMLDAINSPRLIHTHLPPEIIPKDLLKDHKIFYLTRNPKAVVVSYFKHMAALGTYGYRGNFEDFFEMFMNGDVVVGKYFEYTHEFWRLIKDNPNALVLTYEEMKMIPFDAVSRIAKFLGKSISDQLIENIIDMCSFERMITEKKTASTNFPQDLFKEGGSLYHTVPYGDYFKHTQLFWSLIKEKPNVFLLTYEEISREPLETIPRILGKTISNQLAKSIVEMCSFDKMRVEKRTCDLEIPKRRDEK